MKRTVKRCRSWLAAALVLLVYVAARIAWGGLWTMAPVVELDGSADILTIALRHHADEGGNVILTLGNFGQVDFILNQLCSMSKVGIKERTIIVATDVDAQRELAAHGLHSILGRALLLDHVAIEAQTFGTSPYNEIVNLKTRVVLAILQRGYNVLLCDTDIVFMKNPLPYLLDADADITFQHGNPPADPQANGEAAAVNAGNYKNYNTGFYFSRAANRTIRFFEEVVRRQSVLGAAEHDQFLINQVLSEHTHGIRERELSRTLFPNGAWYFWQARPEMVGVCPVMVHVNYIPGHRLKQQHLKQKGVWELDDRLGCRASSELDAVQRCPRQS